MASPTSHPSSEEAIQKIGGEMKIKAWAIVAQGKILEIDDPSMINLYLDCDEAEMELEKIEPYGWIKGKPRVVPVEIQILSRTLPNKKRKK